MHIHRPIIGISLRAAGLVIGILSLISFVTAVADIVALPRELAQGTSDPVDIGTYGLVGLLVIAARAFGTVFGFLVGAMAWVVAIASFAAALAGLILYVIGRGIQRSAEWARILAFLMFAGWLAVLLGALAMLPRDVLPFDWLMMGALIYSLWVLIWRFD